MTPLSNILVFDYETTGIDTTTDRPVQVGVVSADGRILINTLCNPCQEISEGALSVHGISQEDVARYPDYLIVLYLQLQLFSGYEDPIIAGFNTSQFDIPIMESSLKCQVSHRFRQLDVLDVLYRYYPTLKSKRLVNACSSLTGEGVKDAHSAASDCIATTKLLQFVCKDLGKTPDELVRELSTPKPYQIIPVGKYLGKTLEEVPTEWAHWMKDNATNMRPDLQVTIKTILTGD